MPKIGMAVSPLSIALSAKGLLSDILRSGYDFDLIDAHYFYPDGVAAALLGKWFNKPVVVTARGTDINILPNYRIPEKWIRWAAGECAEIITVSEGLRERLSMMQVPDRKLHTLRNGVDLEKFRPLARQEIRQELDVSDFLVLSVGNLVREKGHGLVIEALAGIPGTHLVIIGSGPDEKRLKSLADQVGCHDRVKFIDYLPQSDLVRYYNAADLLVLASESEGMPNVLLEAMACGTPSIASAVGGAIEILTSAAAGNLVKNRNPQSFRRAIQTVIECAPSRENTRANALNFDWASVIEQQVALYRRIGLRNTMQ